MKNKSVPLRRIIPAISAIILLLNTFLITKSTSTKVIILPFLICSFAYTLENIFLMLGKSKLSNLMNKLYISSFLLYAFGFLIFWCYLNIKNNSYNSLILSLPFWLCGIFLTKRVFTKNEKTPRKKSTNKNANSKRISPNFKVIVPLSLIIICFICGAVMLTLGIKNTYNISKKTKNYHETIGFFDSYTIYSTKKSSTYKLIYTYNVNGKRYSISTNYGTGFIPKKGSTRTIKYNPRKKEEAIIKGTGTNTFLIFIGIMFTTIPLIIFLDRLKAFKDLTQSSFDLLGIITGSVFITVGIGILYLLTGGFSLIALFKNYSYRYLIPFLIIIMFIAVGFYQIIRSLAFKNNNLRAKQKS